MSRKSILVFAVLIVILCSYFYRNTVQLPPTCIHAWTQSDRYAIALNFLENGFDFFHPATYNLLTKEGITQVDFPINEFLVAIVMKLYGSTSPAIFRVYDLLVGIIGCLFLFLLTKRITGSEWKGFIVSVFLFSAPVYTYYQAGFLPSVPSVTSVIIGFYFYHEFLQICSPKKIMLAALFLTLAALMRLPFIIFLLAVLGQELVSGMKEKKLRPGRIGILLAGILCVGLYFLYNRHLADKYGTMFLTQLLPISSVKIFGEVFSAIREKWITEYFTIFHYALLLIGIVFLFVNRKAEQKKFSPALGFAFVGAAAVFIALGRQFIYHDYYFLDSFFPAIVLGFVLLLNKINFGKKVLDQAAAGVLVCLSLGAIYQSKQVQAARYVTGPWDKYEVTYQNFEGADKYLNKLGIPASAKVLVIDAYSTNMPLIRMHRKGWTVLDTKKEKIEEFLQKDPDCVVMQNNLALQGTLLSFPELTGRLELIGTNGKILVYKKTKEQISQSISSFLGIDKAEIIAEKSTSGFDPKLSDTHWVHYRNIDSADFASPKFSMRIDSAQDYALSYSDTAENLRLNGKEFVWVSFNVKFISGTNLYLVCIANDRQGKNYHYDSFGLNEFLQPKHEWQRMEYLFQLPELSSGKDILGIYFWNPDKASARIDDLSLRFFRYR